MKKSKKKKTSLNKKNILKKKVVKKKRVSKKSKPLLVLTKEKFDYFVKKIAAI